MTVQLVAFVAFFWLDTIPGFGTSSNVTTWAEGVKSGFQCVFAPGTMNATLNGTVVEHNHCDDAWWIGSLFTGAYVVSYVITCNKQKWIWILIPILPG